MKKHVSVLMLASRATFYKFLTVTLIMALSQAAIFWFYAGNAFKEGIVPELSLTLNRLQYPWIAAMIVIWLLFAFNGTERNSKVGYTIRRLGVSEKEFTLLTSAYYGLCFIIFWTIQLLVVILLYRWYELLGYDYVNHQTFFLTTYNTPFVHSLMPLDDVSMFVRNVIIFLSLGIGAAGFSYRSRHDTKDVVSVIFLLACAAFFTAEVGSQGKDYLLSLVAVIISAFKVVTLLRGDFDEKMA